MTLRAVRQAGRQRLAAVRTPAYRDQGHRTPPGRQALRACYRAHADLEHGGTVGRTCRTCASYLAAIAAAEPETRYEPVKQTP